MKAHGYLDLRWDGDILHVRAVGPFNSEGAEAAAAKYVATLEQKPKPSFAVVEVLDDNSIGPPEAMVEVAKIWNFLGKSGCRALALVYSNEIQARLAEQHLPRYGKLFRDVNDAIEWAREQPAPKDD